MRLVEQKKKDAERKRKMEEAQINNHKKITEKLKEMNKREFLIKDNLHKKQFEKIKEAETKSIIINRKLRKTQEFNDNQHVALRERFEKKQMYLEEVKHNFELQKQKKIEDLHSKSLKKEENINYILV